MAAEWQGWLLGSAGSGSVSSVTLGVPSPTEEAWQIHLDASGWREGWVSVTLSESPLDYGVALAGA